MHSVYRSTTFDAPIADVWPLIRDFNGWKAWLTVLEASEIEDGLSADTVGAVRKLAVPVNEIARERLLGLSDHDHSLTYSLLEVPMPVTDYIATIRLREITDGDRTFAEWSSTFDTPPEHAEAVVAGIGEMTYEAGFAGLRELLAARVA